MNVIIMRDSDNTAKEITGKINSLDELMQLYDEMKNETTTGVFHGITIEKRDYYTYITIKDKYPF